MKKVMKDAQGNPIVVNRKANPSVSGPINLKPIELSAAIKELKSKGFEFTPEVEAITVENAPLPHQLKALSYSWQSTSVVPTLDTDLPSNDAIRHEMASHQGEAIGFRELLALLLATSEYSSIAAIGETYQHPDPKIGKCYAVVCGKIVKLVKADDRVVWSMKWVFPFRAKLKTHSVAKQ